MAEQNIKDWYAHEFTPWRDAMSKYREARSQSEAAFASHMNELQTLAALLLDGRTKQAVLLWNTLGLPPALASIELDRRRDVLVLVTPGKQEIVLQLDDVLADLQAMMDHKKAG